MKSFLTLTLLFTLLFFCSCTFQTSFFKEMNTQYKSKNLIISPLSAYQILGLTANGANNNSLKQMLLALGNENLEELNKINIEIVNIIKQFTTIELANGIMTAFTPKEAFLEISSKYESTIEPLKSVTQVNNWCNLKTHGKIEKIMENLDPNAVMVLLNAIYFKGTWLKEFQENATSTRSFYNFNDESNITNVEMMSIKDYFNYYEDNEIQIVELPYTKDSMSAIIILPNNEININEFISGLDDDTILRCIKKMNNKIVNLQLPKFELEFSSLLNDVLKRMGMVDPFDQNLADLTGLKDENDIYISRVIQKTYLKVDEKGTEAAGATAVEVTTKSLPITYKMNVDRPFLFLLRNKNLPTNYEMIFMAKSENL